MLSLRWLVNKSCGTCPWSRVSPPLPGPKETIAYDPGDGNGALPGFLDAEDRGLPSPAQHRSEPERLATSHHMLFPLRQPPTIVLPALGLWREEDGAGSVLTRVTCPYESRLPVRGNLLPQSPPSSPLVAPPESINAQSGTEPIVENDDRVS